jgi:hypothetical protein
VNASSTPQARKQVSAYSIQQLIDILFSQRANLPIHLRMDEEPDTEMKSFHAYLSGLIQQSISTYRPASEQQSTPRLSHRTGGSFLRQHAKTKSTSDGSMGSSTSSSMKKFGQLLAPWKRNSDSSSQRSLSDTDENGPQAARK